MLNGFFADWRHLPEIYNVQSVAMGHALNVTSDVFLHDKFWALPRGPRRDLMQYIRAPLARIQRIRARPPYHATQRAVPMTIRPVGGMHGVSSNIPLSPRRTGRSERTSSAAARSEDDEHWPMPRVAAEPPGSGIAG